MPAPTPRTTPALVAGLIDVQAGVDLAPFIATASQIITDVCGSSGYTDGYEGSKMELIERWLSAHFYAIVDTQLTMARAGTAEVRFQHKIDYGLKYTAWGQQAIMLDTLGGLASWDNTAQTKRRIAVSVAHLGCTPPFPGDWDGDGWADITIAE